MANLSANAMAAPILLLALCAGSPAFAAFVYPPQGKHGGLTDRAWAARWWQWALAQPAATYPPLDTTGENCAVGQTGNTWFLAGNATEGFKNRPVIRKCGIPAGTDLFFPIMNSVYVEFTDADPAALKLKVLRAGAIANIVNATDLKLTIDGVEVPDLASRLKYSFPFTMVLPDGNVFGVPGGTEVKGVDAGFYVYVKALSPGRHVIRFSGVSPGVFTQDVRYVITVMTPPDDDSTSK